VGGDKRVWVPGLSFHFISRREMRFTGCMGEMK
jgi:hypothetical protein